MMKPPFFSISTSVNHQRQFSSSSKSIAILIFAVAFYFCRSTWWFQTETPMTFPKAACALCTGIFKYWTMVRALVSQSVHRFVHIYLFGFVWNSPHVIAILLMLWQIGVSINVCIYKFHRSRCNPLVYFAPCCTLRSFIFFIFCLYLCCCWYTIFNVIIEIYMVRYDGYDGYVHIV